MVCDALQIGVCFAFSVATGRKGGLEEEINKSFQGGLAVDSEWMLVARCLSGGMEASWVAL
jgi:hypothetical protein